jgi:hypothetical protein
MKRIFVFCVLSFAIAACNKDKVESTPHLKFKSYNTDVVTYNGSLRAILEFTDQEGDLDSVFVTRKRLNQHDATSSYFEFPLKGTVPEFGSQNRGELQLNLQVAYDVAFNLSPIAIPNTNPTQYEVDTLQIRFYVKDKAGHTSDTAVAKPLYVIR